MSSSITTIQRTQMLPLMAGKFVVDMFLGVLPAILPAMREQFAFSLTAGVNIIFAMQITANAVQVTTGHLRANRKKPLLLIIALILAGGLCFVNLVPRWPGALFVIVVLAIVTGCGNGFYNPEALRAVHRLDRISPAMGSTLFTSSGYAGYAIGGWISAILVSRSGLSGLYVLPLLPLAAIAAILLLRVRLFVERARSSTNGVGAADHVPFWPLMLMGTFAAVSSHLLAWLLPTRLRELGFELDFGGFSVMMFCLGAAVGSFFWATVSHKKSPLYCTIAALLSGVPFTIVYLFLIQSRFAVWLLFAAGFNALAVFPLIVTMARAAVGPNLGRRMGLIIGGVWGTAAIVVTALGPAADHFGVQAVLPVAPVGFALAALVGLAIALNAKRQNILNA